MKISPEEVISLMERFSNALGKDNYPHLMLILTGGQKEIEFESADMVGVNVSAQIVISCKTQRLDMLTMMIGLWEKFPTEMAEAYFESKKAEMTHADKTLEGEPS